MHRIALLGALIGISLWPLTVAATETGSSTVTYVGSGSCQGCHRETFQRWRGSHHDLAMTAPSSTTVLGDFDEVTFHAHGVKSRFFRRDGRWIVRTDGPDGALQDYPVRYTFGWWPLQQYLIALPGGRLQALGIAWDSRPTEEGGQRWFHLYPDEPIDHEHPLHWTSREQNWNYQCAECHSTHLNKGYDLATDRFDTTWSEIDVACEACHGPASRHVGQAELRQAGGADAPPWDADKGLVVDLKASRAGGWQIDAETGQPRHSAPRTGDPAIEICARCHARRGQISAHDWHGRPLGETHRLALLGEGLYYADGQIKDEVYVYGSFIQSRMYAQGVTCTDCHDPHSLELKAPGDQVCAQCHAPSRYASEGHHHHPPGSAGASCVACHMPQRRYMVVDERADHSLRIPRPDLTIRIGGPNACNDCHTEQTAQWAAAALEAWLGEAWPPPGHFGMALHAGRTGAPQAERQLLALVADEGQPGIARATALDLLRAFPKSSPHAMLRRSLQDSDDLVRAAAVRLLETTDPRALFAFGFPLLDDTVLMVRTEAARALAPLLAHSLPPVQRQRLHAGLAAYRATQLVNAERPESHLNLGLLELTLGNPEAAEGAYRTALRLDPRFAAGYVNLADLYRTLDRDRDGETVLREGLRAIPNDASLHFALGLLQIRQQRLAEAIRALEQAARLAPEAPRYAYVYGLALERAGEVERALTVLRAAHDRHPNNPDLRNAILAIARKVGD